MKRKTDIRGFRLFSYVRSIENRRRKYSVFRLRQINRSLSVEHLRRKIDGISATESVLGIQGFHTVLSIRPANSPLGLRRPATYPDSGVVCTPTRLLGTACISPRRQMLSVLVEFLG